MSLAPVDVLEEDAADLQFPKGNLISSLVYRLCSLHVGLQVLKNYLNFHPLFGVLMQWRGLFEQFTSPFRLSVLVSAYSFDMGNHLNLNFPLRRKRYDKR